MSFIERIRSFLYRPSLKEQFREMLEQDAEAEASKPREPRKRNNKYPVS